MGGDDGGDGGDGSGDGGDGGGDGGNGGDGGDGGSTGDGGAETITLTWADHWPEGANVVIADEGARYFMERVEEETDAVEFEYFPGGELGGPTEYAGLLDQGAIDIGPVSPQYDSDRFPLSQVTVLPGYASHVESHTRANLELMSHVDGGILYEEEWEPLDYVPLLPYGAAPMVMLLQGDPIGSLDDLDGQRIRSAGGVNEWTIEELGATPVTMDAVEGYTALERGTLDGVTAVIDGIYAFSFQEVTDYVIINGEMNHFVWVDTVRMGAWNDLPSDVQATFNDVASETLDHFIEEQAVFNEGVVDMLREDVDFHELSEDELEVWDASMGDVTDVWLDFIDDQSTGEEALSQFESAAAEYE